MIGSGDAEMSKMQAAASWETQAQMEKRSTRGVDKGLWDRRAGAGLRGVGDDI